MLKSSTNYSFVGDNVISDFQEEPGKYLFRSDSPKTARQLQSINDESFQVAIHIVNHTNIYAVKCPTYSICRYKNANINEFSPSINLIYAFTSCYQKSTF